MKKALLIFIFLFAGKLFAQTQVVTSQKTLTVNSQKILDYNRDRRGFCIYAEGDTCYIKFSNSNTDTVTSTSYNVMLLKNDYYESSGDSRFTGRVTAKCASGTKTILVTYWIY